jgi:hypothetical protein
VKCFANKGSPDNRKATRPFIAKSSYNTYPRQHFFSVTPAQQKVQAKLKVGEANDVFEQEADRIADQVVGGGNAPAVSSPVGNPPLQRKCAECEEEEKLQRKLQDSATPAKATTASSDLIAMGQGNALSSSERSFFEPRFGKSFADVRLHTDENAAKNAAAINARAYTQKNNIVLGKDQYHPSSLSGKHLLAHELTHTIQQGRDCHIRTMPDIQRDEFQPWPGQTGHDVAGTRQQRGDIISEQVQRTGDPTYSQLGPMLLELNTSTCELTVRKEINFVRAGTGDQQLSTDDFNALKTRILDIAREKLNGWVSINVAPQSDQCSLQCANGQINVSVVTTEGSGSYSSTLNLFRSYGRENAGNVGENASDRTLWHELGHIVLGAADEYYESKRPDGTPRPASRVNTSDWSIMSGEANTRRALMHARHFSHLPAWLGRRFPDCNFTLNEASRPIVVEFTPSLMLGGFVGSQGSGGLYYSLGLDMGIPFDRLRRLEFIIGPRFNLISSVDQTSLLMGLRAGLEGQFGSSGFRLGGFGEAGGLGFTDLGSGTLGALPYVEGGLNAGYSFSGIFNVGVELGAGGRESPISTPVPGGPTSEFNPYFRFGLNLSASF